MECETKKQFVEKAKQLFPDRALFSLCSKLYDTQTTKREKNTNDNNNDNTHNNNNNDSNEGNNDNSNNNNNNNNTTNNTSITKDIRNNVIDVMKQNCTAKNFEATRKILNLQSIQFFKQLE